MKRNGLAPDVYTWRILSKLHHYDEEKQEGNHHRTFDVDRISTEDRVEPLVLTKDMMPLLPSSENFCEVNEDNNAAESEEEIGYLPDMASKPEAEDVGYSTKMTVEVEEAPDNTNATKEQGNCLMDNPTRGTTIDKGDITWGDGLKNSNNQHSIREPLSTVAKKVFGLL